VARLKVNTPVGQPAYLSTDQTDASLAFVNPGAPEVTSWGGNGPVVWVLDENAKRTDSLSDPAAQHPILYAIDGTTMAPLWHSPAGTLDVGGKYQTPLVVRGKAIVGTDRIQAFGVTP
jgi:hypothetical protein